MFWEIFLALIAGITAYSLYRPRKSLAKEHVLITGGASGIGRLMALILAKKAAVITLLDINKEGLEKVVAEIKAAGGTAHGYTCDISEREEIYKVAEKVKSEVGKVTILINNAGIVSGKKLLDCPDNLVEKTFRINTMALFWMSKAFLPSMIQENHGHIVTIASTAGTIGVCGLADYCASKFGAFGFDESIRMELRAMGSKVKTTVVCPYYINTGMFEGVKTRFSFILPILEPDYVASSIVNAIETNQEVLVTPRFCYLAPLIRAIMPVWMFDLSADILGISVSMKDFVGRNKKE
eukprot:Colp12_sorted_trinity150504_noHs@23050